MPHFTLDKSVYFMRRRQRRHRRRPQSSVCFRYVCAVRVCDFVCLPFAFYYSHHRLGVRRRFTSLLWLVWFSFRFVFYYLLLSKKALRSALCCVVLCGAVCLFCVFILFFTSFLQSINNWLFTDGGKGNEQCAGSVAAAAVRFDVEHWIQLSQTSSNKTTCFRMLNRRECAMHKKL